MRNLDDSWHRAADVNEIETDEALPVDIGDIEISLCKIEDSVYALNNICTHEYACMSDGFIDGDAIECPLHQAKYHIPTCKVLSPLADQYKLSMESYWFKLKSRKTAGQQCSEDAIHPIKWSCNTNPPAKHERI